MPLPGHAVNAELQVRGRSSGQSELPIQFRNLHSYEDLKSMVWHFGFGTRICPGAEGLKSFGVFGEAVPVQQS